MFRVALFLCFAALCASTPTKSVTKRQERPNIISSCTVPNTVALTFDDGPYLYGLNISDILVNAGAKGTFFYNGNNWDCVYNSDEIQRVKHVFSQGHQVASHTWSHPNLTTLTHDQINKEMQGSEQAIVRITGAYPAFTRPPYGAISDLVVQVARERGQQLAMWDFDSGDSVGASADQQKKNYENIVAQAPSTILALNHETYSTTAFETLPYAIRQLQDAGYQLVTLAECLGRQPYKSVGSPATPDSTWHC